MNGRSQSPRLGKTLFWFLATGLVLLRFVLAVRAPRLHEIEHIWQPIAQEALSGKLLWSNSDFHFFAPWGWLLPLFERAARAGVDFAAAQRSVLVLVDVATAVLISRLAAHVPGALSPRAAALSYLANPVAIFVCSVQGQFDGISIAFLVAAVLCTVAPREAHRAPWAGLLLGLSVAAKQVTLLHPLLWLRRPRGLTNVAVAYVLPFVTLLPYLAAWRVIARSLLVYYSVPLSYGLSELVLWDSRIGPAVSALCLVAALLSIVWLRGKELTRSCLFLFLVLLFLAPGLGSQYLLWPVPFGAVLGGVPYLAFTAASTLWVVGSYFGWPGSGQWMGQLVWISVGVWMFFESRVLGSQTAQRPA